MSNTMTHPTGTMYIDSDQPAPEGDWVHVNYAGGREVYTACGSSYHGETILCDVHLAEAEKMYPQGWRYYPGDVCRHGKYTGGCGADLMCGRCEMGDDEEDDDEPELDHDDTPSLEDMGLYLGSYES